MTVDRILRLGVIALSLGLLAVTDGHAQTHDDEQTVHNLVKQGDFEAATRGFEGLYARSPEPKYLLNIAIIYKDYLQGRCADATRVIDRFFLSCPNCELKKNGELIAQSIRRSCYGTVRIQTKPVGATLSVDGSPHGVTPVELSLVDGPHVAATALAGFKDVQTPFLVAAGQATQLIIPLTSTTAPAPSPDQRAQDADAAFAKGRALAREGQHEAAILEFERGNALVGAPRFPLEIARSRLALRSCEAAKSALIRFEAVCRGCGLAGDGRALQGEIKTECLAPPAKQTSFGPWTWTALGVGAAGVVAGGIFTGLYLSDRDARDDALDDGSGLARVRGLHDDAVLDYQLMQVGFGVGVAGLATALVLWLYPDARTDATAGVIRPGEGGWSIGGRF